jgi:REP element-mobilizing transposase RayT
MGRSRYRVGDPKVPHFVTCTILNWIALFTRPQTVDIILQALQYRQENAGWKVYGYVILENHLHLVVQCENLVEEFPRFKSYYAFMKDLYFPPFLVDCFKGGCRCA